MFKNSAKIHSQRKRALPYITNFHSICPQWSGGKFGAGGTLGGPGADSPAVSMGRTLVGGQEAKPPEAESFFVFGYPKGWAIFHLTSKFRKLRKPHIF